MSIVVCGLVGFFLCTAVANCLMLSIVSTTLGKLELLLFPHAAGGAPVLHRCHAYAPAVGLVVGVEVLGADVVALTLDIFRHFLNRRLTKSLLPFFFYVVVVVVFLFFIFFLYRKRGVGKNL